MNNIKLILSLSIKHFWNIFSIIGVVATFYFGLFSVPDYVKEKTAGNVNLVNESLINDIQEILFYDKKLSIEDIDSYIQGKELQYSIVYPYSPVDLLLLVQDRFVRNKFIPLDKRESLKTEIAVLTKSYKIPLAAKSRSFSWLALLPWFFSGVGLGVTALGVISIIKKMRLDQETEVDLSSTEIYENDKDINHIYPAIEFENMVSEILKELNVSVPLDHTGRDHRYDFLVKSGDKEFIVEVKKFRKTLGVGTARDFLYKVDESKKSGVLIVSSGVTQRTRKLIEEHNNKSEYATIHLIVGESKETIKNELKKIFYQAAT